MLSLFFCLHLLFRENFSLFLYLKNVAAKYVLVVIAALFSGHETYGCLVIIVFVARLC